MTILGGIALVLAVIMVAGPIRGGYDMAMLRLIRGDDSVSFRDLFAGFSKFRKLFLTFLLYSLADEYAYMERAQCGRILWLAILLVIWKVQDHKKIRYASTIMLAA